MFYNSEIISSKNQVPQNGQIEKIFHFITVHLKERQILVGAFIAVLFQLFVTLFLVTGKTGHGVFAA